MVVFVRNRQDLEHQIIILHADGWPIRALCRHFAMGRNTIRRIIRKNHRRREKGHDVLVPKKPVVRKSKLDGFRSLQNPCDPDAAYSGYKGQGYQIQVMESFTRTEDKQQKEKTLNLITHVAVEKACEHDSNALIPAIEDTEQQGLKPKTILADTLYGGDDNSELAKTHNVELVSPTFKKDNSRGLSCFRFDDQGRVTSCRQATIRSRSLIRKRPIWVPFPFVKERICGFLAGFSKISPPRLSATDWQLDLAA